MAIKSQTFKNMFLTTKLCKKLTLASYRNFTVLNSCCVSATELYNFENKSNIPELKYFNICKYSSKHNFNVESHPYKGHVATIKKLRPGVQTGNTLFEDIMNELLANNAHNCSDESWIMLKQNILNHPTKSINVNEKNIDVILMKYLATTSNIHLARGYLKYLTKLHGNDLKNLNVILISYYLKVNYKCQAEIDESDIKIVETICEIILQKLPLVDYKLSENLIRGLCVTNKWKESLKVIEAVKDIYNLSSASYAAVIKCAFIKNERDLGWKLLDHVTNGNYKINNSVYETLLDTSTDKKLCLNKLFLYFQRNFEVPEIDLGYKFVQYALELQGGKKKQIKYSGFFNAVPAVTTISSNGICYNCKNQLQSGELVDGEFEKLRSSFLDPVLIGKDIFYKTTPEELSKFREFLQKTAPYDFVLDGLNIAYSAGNKSTLNRDANAQKLMDVVKYFVKNRKKVLVLGRRHMKNWTKHIMNYIKENTHLFLAENVSEDDPFVLYAAIYSGINTNLVSNDLMRGHKYLLNLQSPELKIAFWNWQYQHQYVIKTVVNRSDVIFWHPLKYYQNAHFIIPNQTRNFKVGSGQTNQSTKRQSLHGNDTVIWHIPCKENLDLCTPGRAKVAFRKWLCIPMLQK